MGTLSIAVFDSCPAQVKGLGQLGKPQCENGKTEFSDLSDLVSRTVCTDYDLTAIETPKFRPCGKNGWHRCPIFLQWRDIETNALVHCGEAGTINEHISGKHSIFPREIWDWSALHSRDMSNLFLVGPPKCATTFLQAAFVQSRHIFGPVIKQAHNRNADMALFNTPRKLRNFVRTWFHRLNSKETPKPPLSDVARARILDLVGDDYPRTLQLVRDRGSLFEIEKRQPPHEWNDR